MSAVPLAILSTGLVTSVGLSAAASCAAIRAKISNPTETRFIDSTGEWIMAHQVLLEQPWRGLEKLARMAVMAIEEALEKVPREEWESIPLLLCVAEAERPGRMEGLDNHLLPDIQVLLGATFSTQSRCVPHGRVAVAVAMAQARVLVHVRRATKVLIVAADSMLSWPTLSRYEQQDRLLTPTNSNGFMPGEGAGAVLLGPPPDARNLMCTGLGFGVETAVIEGDEPLRADGLTYAIKAALADAGCGMHDMDYRITDLSGEQYYFKEAALALSRSLRQRKEQFDIWHPAESTGMTGAALGTVLLALAESACRKGYTNDRAVLIHLSNDGGQRSAATLHFGSVI